MKKIVITAIAFATLTAAAVIGFDSSPDSVETSVLDATEVSSNDATEANSGAAEEGAEDAIASNRSTQADDGLEVVAIRDTNERDGAVPPQAPEGAETGWDLEDIQFTYDPATDELLVRLTSFGIIGDPEGNGDPSSWSPIWDDLNLPGTDSPDLGGLEYTTVTFDLDQNGTGDVVAGVSQGVDINGFSINSLTFGLDPVPFILPAFGAPLTQHIGQAPTSPTAESPDFVFSIADFSQIAGDDGLLDFGVNAFAGSSSDNNVGEDTLTGAGTFLPVNLTARIGDTVFFDEDGNGIQDPAEPGVEGVTVSLLDDEGNVLEVQETGPTGEFLFIVAPGDFVVEFETPEGFTFTDPFQGTDVSIDSDADPASGQSPVISVSAGDENLTIDAGIIEFVAAPSIDIEKATNGQDADTPEQGPVLEVGSTVTFTYVATNDGNIDLVDVAIVDDILGDICTIASLAVGESDTCEATAEVVEGAYRNVATATGQPVDDEGNPIGDPVSDEDPSHHIGEFVSRPGIDIEKSTNGEDADEATGPVLEIGSIATFEFVVTNTGNVTLNDIEVVDNILGNVCVIETLEVGGTASCEATAEVVDGQHRNDATATGQPVDDEGNPIGDPVSDEDPSHHIGEPPAGPPCVADVSGPRLFAGDRVVWDTGYDAAAGSTLVIETEEPGGSPGQPNEQVYIFVGDDVYGPTPVGLGTIEVEVENTGRLSFVHYSVVTGDVSQPNSVEVTFCGTGISLTQRAACTENISGPRLHAGGQVRYDLNQTAAAGSVIRITTTEPGDSPDQPNEQVWVKVGPELFGPTPVGLGTLEFTATLGGEVIVFHHSRITGDDSAPNSVEYQLCGTHLG